MMRLFLVLCCVFHLVGLCNSPMLYFVVISSVLFLMHNICLVCDLFYSLLATEFTTHLSRSAHARACILERTDRVHAAALWDRVSRISHIEGSSTSVGRPGYCHSPVIAVKTVDVPQPILLNISFDGVRCP